VNDERPGRFFNPIIASLVTGASRLVLTMLEAEVTKRGGTFAFCDTDSLAIVAGKDCPHGVPCLSEAEVDNLVRLFDPLNPYDPTAVPHLLKVEYKNEADLRCFAISAKRYVLFTLDRRSGQLKRVVKASESGLGAVIGRSKGETTRKLARRVWKRILADELGLRVLRRQKRRWERLIDFAVPLRRKLPISNPAILKTRGFAEFNKTKTYDFKIKPFGFLQTVTPGTVIGDEVKAIAPMESDLRKTRKLPWTDFRTGKMIELDWDGLALAGSMPIMSLADYVTSYASHPEAKAAGTDGKPSGREARGVLGRLHLTAAGPAHIGKEIDRLDEDQGESLDDDGPITYDSDNDRGYELAIDILSARPRGETASELRVSVRRLQDILKGRSAPRPKLRAEILRLARGNV
jgi:hypothetical protein